MECEREDTTMTTTTTNAHSSGILLPRSNQIQRGLSRNYHSARLELNLIDQIRNMKHGQTINGVCDLTF